MIMKAARLSLFPLLAILVFSTSIQDAHAVDQIIRPYQSARSAAMGGVHLTTGLYDENFFGNPARAMANPTWRVTVLDPMVEVGTKTISTAGNLTSGGDTLTKIGDTAGNDNHGRFQTTMPAIYIPHIGNEGKWSFAFAFIESLQFDMDLRRSFQVSPQAIWDVGPAVTVARNFKVKDRDLAVGVTPHMTYRISSPQNYGFSDLIAGKSLSPLQSGGDGTEIDADLGSTYVLPWQLNNFDFSVGAAINNMFGGNYTGSPRIANTGNRPLQQPRSFGMGIAAHKSEFWKFAGATFALELTDFGNNPNGGFWRQVHLGGELKWSVLLPRFGINQGYLCAGVGLDLKHFQLDLTTYGEELSLNSGGLEDRRYAVHFAFNI